MWNLFSNFLSNDFARETVRFTKTISFVIWSDSPSRIDLMVPPAPNIKIDLFFNWTPWLLFKSFKNPWPSVVSPCISVSLLNNIVLTDPDASARWVNVVHNEQTSSLNGTVIFKPLPPCEKKDFIYDVSLSAGTSIAL